MATDGLLPVPPRRVAPHDFYHEYLPRLWRAVLADALLPWDVRLGVEIRSPADALVCRLRLAGAALEVHDEAPADDLVTYRCTLAAWQCAIHQVLPLLIKQTNAHARHWRTFVHRALQHPRVAAFPGALRRLPGTLGITYTDDAGDCARFELAIAGGRGPNVHVEATDADLWALLRSRGRVLRLLRSRMRITGDLTYLLQLARLVDAEGQ